MHDRVASGHENAPAAGIKAVVNLLGEHQLCYCILHGWQSLFEEWAGDVDIAITSRDLRKMESAFRNSADGRLVQLLQHQVTGYYFVLALRRDGTRRFITVDAAVDYRVGGCVFFTAADLLRRRQRVNGLWVAAPETEFAYLFVKKAFKGVFPRHQIARLLELHKLLGEEAAVIIRRLIGPRVGNQVISWIDQSDWATFETRLPHLKRALRWQAIKHDPLSLIHYWIPELRRRWRRWSRPTGLFVAVLGPDGAGKTTLINRLEEGLAGAFRRTAVFHLCASLIDRNPMRGPVTDPHGKAPYPLWISLLKIPYYLLAYAVGYLFKVRPLLVRSTLVLLDRYYDDILVDPRRYRYGGPMELARLGRLLVPTPDLYFIVDVPEEHLYQRKQEVSRDEVERQRAAYRRLAVGLPTAVLLDGSLPADDVARRASDVVLDHLERRYTNRCHLWFSTEKNETLDT